MTLDKWRDLLDRIKDQFTIEDSGSRQVDEHLSVEFVTFTSSVGLMKLELEIRPIVMDKKTFYSNRIGSDVEVEYVYSPTEKTTKLLAWRWSDDDNRWSPIQASSLGF